MSQLVRYSVSGGDALLHFPSDGQGGYTSLAGTAARTATFTDRSATLTGGQVVPGAAGDRGYCFTSDGYYAPYQVVTAGANGVVAVDIWRHGTAANVGNIPTGTITFHTPGGTLGTFLGSFVESITLRVGGTGGTLTLTDAKGAAVEIYTWGNAVAPSSLIGNEDGVFFKGPFGFQITAGSGQIELDILFRPDQPTTAAQRAFAI